MSAATAQAPPRGPLGKVRTFLEAIKFEHTVFALPFAYLGMLLAAGGAPTLAQFIWITVAMGAARTGQARQDVEVSVPETGRCPHRRNGRNDREGGDYCRLG